MKLGAFVFLLVLGSSYATSITNSVFGSAHIEIDGSPMLKYLFNEHALHLAEAAKKYEQEHEATSFTQFHSKFYQQQLTHFAELLSKIQLDLRDIFIHKEVRSSLCKITRNRIGNVHHRLGLWQELARNIHSIQIELRTHRLPDVKFQHYDSDGNAFLTENHAVLLSDQDENNLVADKLLSFFPLALMEQYDNEAFEAFLKLRNKQ